MARKRKEGIPSLLGDLVDNTADLFDEVIQRTWDANCDSRKACSRIVSPKKRDRGSRRNKRDRARGEGSVGRALDRLESRLGELGHDVERLLATEAERAPAESGPRRHKKPQERTE
ncbi:hypothetical protein [Streptomyces enissocaesilis]|uniref:Transposase n=1 Tax=Streptomyces enissocaesilis TaxID=332589 RepID=A0ABP6K5K8_9ACTN